MDQADWNGKIDCSGNKEITVTFAKHNVISMEWSNFSHLLAVATFKSHTQANCSGLIQILDPNSRKTYTIAGEIKPPSRLKWSLDDKTLFAFGDNFIYALDVTTGKLIWEKSFKSSIIDFDLTSYYFAIAFEAEINIYSYSGDLLRNLDLNTYNIKIKFGDFITFSPNQSLISIYSYEGEKAIFFNVGAGEFLYTIDAIHRKNALYSWAFPRHEPDDCFQYGVSTSDKKFHAIAPCAGKRGSLLPRHSIKISSLF